MGETVSFEGSRVWEDLSGGEGPREEGSSLGEVTGARGRASTETNSASAAEAAATSRHSDRAAASSPAGGHAR